MTWGFEFISYTVDIGFWGIAIVMVMQYFRKYAGRDSLGIRIVTLHGIKALIRPEGGYQALQGPVRFFNMKSGSIQVVQTFTLTNRNWDYHARGFPCKQSGIDFTRLASLGINPCIDVKESKADCHSPAPSQPTIAVFLAILNYKYFITLFGDFEGHDVILYEANVMLCSVYIVAFVSHISRIWIYKHPTINRNVRSYLWPVTKHNWKYVLPVTLSLRVVRYYWVCFRSLPELPISSTQSGAALACDLVITAILCFILRSSRTGVDRTDSVLDKMVMYALNRGVMTSLWALLQLIFFVAMPQSFVFDPEDWPTHNGVNTRRF
ncbi:hypothetical protein C8R43DRAFT_1183936 [Mycena crocata]|nr:hypothetical protein C8R43DRAFT_1183936 [Mycena crocata]